jgi:hypothetical protein
LLSWQEIILPLHCRSFFLANQHEDDFDRMLREQILAESYDSLVLDVALTSQQHPGYAPQMRKLKYVLQQSRNVDPFEYLTLILLSSSVMDDGDKSSIPR